ncbi:hypothetical protein FM038_020340 [Shewanella eurypsychrophilus]|uniref:Uncharacterized protein n=1 Tax=Shewanella eurypsychrophilus TaxID=2593656 RepID=A0ABX6V9Y6_9GAMM|nr:MULTISPECIES: hypothetical protein [Shewanella]QFU24268.1 hypothetical protein FS418_22060 [Shewanella sp. YLB-09]QPG59471.1 hypothetical protein FM038_020340 [Shewanella eurypsychrophilus]
MITLDHHPTLVLTTYQSQPNSSPYAQLISTYISHAKVALLMVGMGGQSTNLIPRCWEHGVALYRTIFRDSLH